MGTGADIDVVAVRSAVGALIGAEDYDSWLLSAAEGVLIRLAAPLEMLQFQYYLTPPQDRHLIRAALVCCEAAEAGLQGCPAHMIDAFAVLARELGGRGDPNRDGS